MKNLFFLMCAAFVVGCSSTNETVDSQNCFQDAGVTSNNKNPHYDYSVQNLAIPNGSEKFYAKKIGDTLKIMIATYNESHLRRTTFNFLCVDRQCPRALNAVTTFKPNNDNTC